MCLAHLLRELEYLTELDPKQQWSKDVASLFRQAIHERNTRPNEFIDKRTWLDKLDDLLKANLLHLRSNFERLRNGLANAGITYSTSWKIPQFHPTTMRAREESEN